MKLSKNVSTLLREVCKDDNFVFSGDLLARLIEDVSKDALSGMKKVELYSIELYREEEGEWHRVCSSDNPTAVIATFSKIPTGTGCTRHRIVKSTMYEAGLEVLMSHKEEK